MPTVLTRLPKTNNADAPVVIHPCERRNQPNKKLPDPDGIGAGLSQHCAASVFSSQTINLQFVDGTGPSQRTESVQWLKKDPTHPQMIILHLIMSDIQRITLISDPTNEIPKNANNSSKVGLPERLTLPGDRWHASLLSMSVPDQGQSNGVIATDPHTNVVTFSVTYLTRKYINGDYRRVSFRKKEHSVELEDIMSAKHPVTSGSLFWKRLMQEVHNTIVVKLMYEQDYAKTFDGDERSLVSVKKNWMPTMTWKEDALILHAVPKGELLNTNTFALDLGVAEKFGLIEQPQGVVGYVLSPNLQFTCPPPPPVTYTDKTHPIDPSNGSDTHWNGEHYAGTQLTDLTRDISDITYQVKNKRLHLSRMMEWQFNNLNSSFEKLVGTSKRTVMVYSDVVESSVVGNDKCPVLREVQLLRTRDGRSIVEPLHLQWIKVRGNIGYCGSGDCYTRWALDLTLT